MSAKFSVLWCNNSTWTRSMCTHTFRLRDLGIPDYHNVHVHVDQIHILFRPTKDIGIDEFQAPDTDQYDWHAEADQILLRCTPGVRHPLYVGDDPSLSTGTSGDIQPVQRVCTYSSALATTPNVNTDESYWCRTYRPIRDLPVVTDTANLSEWQLELIFPLLLGDQSVLGTEVPSYRIHKVYCEFSIRW